MNKDEILEMISRNTISSRIEEGTDLIHEIYVNDFVDELLKAINFIPCCTELKDKKALNFDEWLSLNNYAKSSEAKYLDKNANWFTEKQLLKMYNDIF